MQDLDALPGDRRVNGLLVRDRVAFDVQNVARREQIRWERLLNRYQSRCGCVTGAACLLITLMAGGVYVVSTTRIVFSLEFLGRAVLILLAAAIFGLLGKLVALEITRIQFARACGRLREELLAHQVGGGVRPAWEG
jgi:hypothetical protein